MDHKKKKKLLEKLNEFTSEVEAVLKSPDHMVSRPAGIKKLFRCSDTCILQQCGHLKPQRPPIPIDLMLLTSRHHFPIRPSSCATKVVVGCGNRVPSAPRIIFVL
jgi:hypothetical protein